MKRKQFNRIVLIAFFAFGVLQGFSQAVKIGDNLGNHKATLDLNMNNQKIVSATGLALGTATFTNNSVSLELAASDKAILLNRVTALTDIVAPVNGMVVYNNADNKFYVRQNGVWVTFGVSTDLVISLTAATVGNSPNGNGITFSSSQGNIIATLQPADATHPGVITAGAQTIGGDKTLTGNTVLQALAVTSTVQASGISSSASATDVILVQDASGYIRKSALFAGSINKLNIAVPAGTSALFTSDNVMVTITLTVTGISVDDGVIVNFSTADMNAFSGLTIMSAVASAANTVKVTIADVRNPADPSYSTVAIDGKNFTVTYLHK